MTTLFILAAVGFIVLLVGACKLGDIIGALIRALAIG
jgi:Sec-independent protein translocase protein TatA